MCIQCNVEPLHVTATLKCMLYTHMYMYMYMHHNTEENFHFTERTLDPPEESLLIALHYQVTAHLIQFLSIYMYTCTHVVG